MAQQPITHEYLQGLSWITPPENQGQIVTESYASDDEACYSRVHDGSDGSTSYYVARFGGKSAVPESWFEPWNGVPDAPGVTWERIADSTAARITYTYHEDGGHSEEIIDAGSMEEAEAVAEDLLRDGDWGPEGGEVSARVIATDQDGHEVDRRSVTVTLEPNEHELIERAGGDPDCTHHWTSEGEGGCDENPGVWGIGGAAVLIREHCSVCGIIRETVTGDVDTPSRNSVTYRLPEES